MDRNWTYWTRTNTRPTDFMANWWFTFSGMARRLRVLPFLSCLVLLTASSMIDAADEPQSGKSPLSTDEALRSFVLASSELKVELVAGEPEVIDPVAIAFGADTSMWVIEMRDYPFGPKPGTDERPKSRIKHLFDHNHDGRYETAVVFADELLFATGILPWKDGVIVTMSGEIAFLADRNGDGKSDFKEIWFQGFSQENSQLRANHPTLGPDGFVYVANGLRGGTIVATKAEWRDKALPLPLAGFDFRFNPLTGEYGAVSGHGQYGLAFDDFGNRFVCSNRNPVQHVVLEDHYTKRNPFFAVKTTVQDVAASAEQSKLYPISQTWTTSALHANQFTAACGITIFRGDGLPPENKGNAFTCDPTGNLVHRETLVAHGATFTSHPSDGQQEFLASTDSWFRPVDLANGPDGSLYIVDMYRAVIEHPDWMPVELRSRKDLYDGSDRGRIWRVKSDDSILPQERPDHTLNKLTVPQLVQLLDHRNAWHRETAFRLLLEKHRDEVLDALKANWKQNTLTRSRLPVLWMMRLLDPRLTPAVLAWSEIDNRDPRVREQVVSLIGDNLDELLPDDIISVVSEEADDRVRFRLALDLSGRSPDAILGRKSLIRLLDRGVEDPWLRVAVCTLKSDPPQAFLSELLDHWATLKKAPAGAAELIESLSEIVGVQLDPKSSRPVLVKMIEFHPSDWGDLANEVAAFGVRGFGRGTVRRGHSFQTYRSELSAEERQRLSKLMRSVLATASDAQLPAPKRISAIRTLAYADETDVLPTLTDLALNSPDNPLRLAALDALGIIGDPAVGEKLLSSYPTQTPLIRRAIQDLLLTSEPYIGMLLTALESGSISVSEIDPARQTRLSKSRSKELSARADKLFASSISADRAEVLARYQAAIRTKGDPTRGRAVFEKNCVTCHRVADLGVNVGPEIGDTYNKTPEYLLTNILDPNRAIDANYFAFTIVTTQGKTYTGLIKSETAVSITIRMPEGKEETILRSDIEELKTSGQSLMPVGMEKSITVEQMTDLISFLKNWRYLEGSIPLPE